jgi:hypothetical protein
MGHFAWITAFYFICELPLTRGYIKFQNASVGISLPGSTQLMDYALHMLLVTASTHFSHPHLMQGVLEMFLANPVKTTDKSSVQKHQSS